MKKSIPIAILFFVSSFCFSQAPSPEALKKIESARIAFLTHRLDLSPKQAKEFWPLYNDFSQKRRHLRREYITLSKTLKQNQLTEAEGKKLLVTRMQLKEKGLTLEKTYAKKLTEVIGARKLISLQEAETDFRKLLLKRLQKRRGNRNN